jgi:hypothetical protein
MKQVRVHVLLEPRQHAALTKLAGAEKKSVSAIIRQITDDYLARTQRGEDPLLETLDRFRAIRKKQSPYEGDLVSEIRS